MALYAVIFITKLNYPDGFKQLPNNKLLEALHLTLNSSSESAPLACEELLPAASSPLSESSLSPYIPRPACAVFQILKISVHLHNTA
jgi:hypothetical protein